MTRQTRPSAWKRPRFCPRRRRSQGVSNGRPLRVTHPASGRSERQRWVDCVEKPRDPVFRKSGRNALLARFLSAMPAWCRWRGRWRQNRQVARSPASQFHSPATALIFRARRRKRTFSTQSVESCRKPIARRRPFVVLADRCLALRSEKGQGAAHQRDALEGACAARRLAAICAGQRRTTGWPVGFDSPWTAARRPARG